MILDEWKISIFSRTQPNGSMRAILIEIGMHANSLGVVSISLGDVDSIAKALVTTHDDAVERIHEAQKQGWLAPIQWNVSTRAYQTRLTGPAT